MSLSNAVSLHPYFKAHPGKLETIKALLPRFVAKTRAEGQCFYYEFTIDGDTVFCREGYAGAEGVLAHLANVDAELEEMLTHSDLLRLEVHGPAAELEKLEAPMGGLNPAWFALECGI